MIRFSLYKGRMNDKMHDGAHCWIPNFYLFDGTTDNIQIDRDALDTTRVDRISIRYRSGLAPHYFSSRMRYTLNIY